jgi:hypothetical protein
VLAGRRGHEPHDGQVESRCSCLESCLGRPFAYQHEHDHFRLTLAIGGLDDRIEVVRETVQADVGGDELALEPEAEPELAGGVGNGAKEIQTCPVRHDAELGLGHAPTGQPGHDGADDGDHPPGAPVADALHPACDAHRRRVSQLTEAYGGLGRQVALEH